MAEGATQLNINNCLFDFNSANNGGAICVKDESTKMIIKDSTIHKNQASQYGGGIYVHNKGSIDVRNCDITENTAQTKGGGIYGTDSETSVLVKDSSINENKGNNGAGGFMVYNFAYAAVENTQFDGNTMTISENGNAFRVEEYAQLVMDGCTS